MREFDIVNEANMGQKVLYQRPTKNEKHGCSLW
jgi:hypothetical protein